MIAAFGTLAFLATLWLLVVVGAAVLEESGAQDRRCPQGQAERRLRRRVAPSGCERGFAVRPPMRAGRAWRAAA